MQGVLEKPVKVRTDLQVDRQIQEGEPFYVVKDPLTLRYFRMKELEHFIFSSLDGTRTIEDLRQEVAQRFSGLQVPFETIKEFILTLYHLNFLESFGPQADKLLYRKLQLKRKAKLKQRLSSFLFFQLPLCDPDEFFKRIVPHLRFLWTKTAWAFWWACLLAAILVVATHWSEVTSQIHGFLNWRNLLLAWGVLMGVKVLHELGHGLTCRHYGGEVHEMGLLIIVFTPCMYCNVSDAWTFRSNRDRLLVTMAGILTELWVASVAAIIWSLTAPGVINSLCYTMMFICSVGNLLFNANPLLRYDGYYALSDYLEIPNLRIRSTLHLFEAFKKNILRMPIEEKEELSERQKSIFLIYGILSFCYRWFIMIVIVGLVASRFFIIGVLMAIGLLILSILLPLKKFFGFLIQNRKQIAITRGAAIPLTGLLVLLMATMVFYRWEIEVNAGCTVEPVRHVLLRSETAGRLETLQGREGERVKAGQALARLEEPTLTARQDRLLLDRSIVNQELIRTLGLNRITDYHQYQIALQRLEKEILEVRSRTQKLTLRAPIDGIILTPRLAERMGDYLNAGDPLCEIGDLQTVLVRITVPESDMADVGLDQPVELKAYAYPHLTFQGRVVQIAPQRSAVIDNPALSARFGGKVPSRPDPRRGEEVPLVPIFQVVIQVENPNGALRPGMTGLAKIHCGEQILGRLLLRRFQQFFKPKLFI